MRGAIGQSRGAARFGFTLVEVMIAMAIFAIAFSGIIALIMVHLKEDLDSQNRMAVAARARHELETIRSIADAVPAPLDPEGRPGIDAVLRYYLPTAENTVNTRFSMSLPTVLDADQPQGEVVVHVNENAVPAYFANIGDIATADYVLGEEADEDAVVWVDLNQNGAKDLGALDYGLKMLPVEVIIRYKGSRGEDRAYRLATLVTN